MSVIFMFSLLQANIESATSDVQKSRLKMVEGLQPFQNPRSPYSFVDLQIATNISV